MLILIIVQRNYRVRLTNVPNNDLTLQNFQDATFGKKLAKTIDHTFKWRKPMESDLLDIDNENFPSFANYLSQKRGVTGNKDKPLKSTLFGEVPKNSTNKKG